MTFISDEQGQYSSRPQEGYVITAGATILRFVNQPLGSVLDGVNTYIPVAGLQRRRIVRKEVGASGSEVEVQLPRSLLASYVPGYPPDPFLITITRYQPTGNQEIFNGEITNTNIQGVDVLLRCVGKTEMRMARKAPNVSCMPSCPRVLFDSWCRVSRATHELFTIILDVDDLVLSVSGVAGQANGYFAGGEMVFNGEKRLITSQVGTTLTLNHAFRADIDGETVSIFPGCDKAVSTCTTKFNNRNNFQGVPFQPLQNIHILGIKGLRVI